MLYKDCLRSRLFVIIIDSCYTLLEVFTNLQYHIQYLIEYLNDQYMYHNSWSPNSWYFMAMAA